MLLDVIFTNLIEAFDHVNHATLIEILSKTEFGEPFLSWLKSYLSDKIQCVKIISFKSYIFQVLSNIP